MAEQESVRVMVRSVADVGQTYKIEGADEMGNVRTYTMMKTDRDTGQMNTPPNMDEDCIFIYGTQTGEYRGKQQTTYWLNEVRMPQMPRDNATPPPPVQAEQPETAPENPEPIKDAYDMRQDATRISIEKQQCLKHATEYYSGSQSGPEDVVKAAWHFYEEFMLPELGPAAIERLMADVQPDMTQEEQGEVIQNSSHSYAPQPEYTG